MPRLHVVALSGRLPDWAEEACAEYAKRMPKGYEVERAAVKRLALPKNSHVIALDERGKDLTTQQFAGLLQRETVFVIGGPDGLDEKIKREAAMLLRLSSLTLPHALAQVVLLEQIYRAATMLTGHPYHRA
ncbi:MAG TPA: 23S rRNA (pseudouridine(1915)-N(3))-methyltransferase RlmH [Burkholderiales bacterium]|nr:23S rRNA (pseudouridine(1915)-N(3))-methyltransferase RlmH [Burkholderiales bacterium]